MKSMFVAASVSYGISGSEIGEFRIDILYCWVVWSWLIWLGQRGLFAPNDGLLWDGSLFFFIGSPDSYN